VVRSSAAGTPPSFRSNRMRRAAIGPAMTPLSTRPGPSSSASRASTRPGRQRCQFARRGPGFCPA
jgi:hypothetical protein